MREVVKLTVKMKKAGKQTYLNEDQESLVISSADIEVVYGLPFDYHSVIN